MQPERGSHPLEPQSIPVEVLIHVFGNLELADRKSVMQVCKHWHDTIVDDACWRAGFISYFKGLPFQRLGDWSLEYITHLRFKQTWNAFTTRIQVVQFDMSIGSVGQLYELNEGFIATSVETGKVVQCTTTGKQSRDVINCYSSDFDPQISCIALSRSFILIRNHVGFGNVNGQISLLVLSKNLSKWHRLTQVHTSNVDCISFFQETWMVSSSFKSILLVDLKNNDVAQYQGHDDVILSITATHTHILARSLVKLYIWNICTAGLFTYSSLEPIILMSVDPKLRVCLLSTASQLLLLDINTSTVHRFSETGAHAAVWAPAGIEFILYVGHEANVSVFKIHSSTRADLQATLLTDDSTAVSIKCSNVGLLVATHTHVYLFTTYSKIPILKYPASIDNESKLVFLENSLVWASRDKICCRNSMLYRPKKKRLSKKQKYTRKEGVLDVAIVKEELLVEYHQKLSRYQNVIATNGDHGMSQHELEEYMTLLSLDEAFSKTATGLTEIEMIELAIQLSMQP